MTSVQQRDAAAEHAAQGDMTASTAVTMDDVASAADARDGKALWKAIALVCVIAACIAVVVASPIKDQLEPNLLKAHHWVERFGVWPTAVGFVVLAATGLAMAIPRLLFAAAAGVLFEDVAIALVVAQTATVLGCWINFTYARALGREFVRRKLGPRFSGLARVLDFIGRHGVMGNILVRGIPVGNSFVLNLLMAVSPIRVTSFLVGTAIGTIPATTVYVLLGSSAHSDHAATTIGLSLGLMALWCVPYALWLRRRRAKRLAAASA